MTHYIKVENVKCDSCVNTIKAELQKLEGIKSIGYNKDDHKLTVEGSEERDTITKVLAKIGYPEKE